MIVFQQSNRFCRFVHTGQCAIPKIKVCLQKIELYAYNAYTDVHCFKIISSNSLIIMLLYHVLPYICMTSEPTIDMLPMYQGFIHEAL